MIEQSRLIHLIRITFVISLIEDSCIRLQIQQNPSPAIKAHSPNVPELHFRYLNRTCLGALFHT